VRIDRIFVWRVVCGEIARVILELRALCQDLCGTRSRTMKKGGEVTSKWRLALTICVWLSVFEVTHTKSVQAQAELPVKVQADLLRNKIIDAAKTNDLQGALRNIDEYKKLKTDFPPALLLVEAKAAHKTGDTLRALAALQSFLSVSQTNSRTYEEALALYPTYQKDAAPALQKVQEAKDRAEQEKLAAEELQKQAEREKLLAEQSKRQAEEATIAAARTKISAVVAEIGNQMISIPAHRCHIGDGSEKDTPWNPERWIEFPKLRFQKYDITSDTYELFATVTGRKLPKYYTAKGDLPAEVGWDDAKAFISWLNGHSNAKYRLPTAPEWECVARDGVWPGFPWGIEDADKYGLFSGPDGKQRPITSVGQFLPNKAGIYDMWGLVEQWTDTCGVQAESVRGKIVEVSFCDRGPAGRVRIGRGGQTLNMTAITNYSGEYIDIDSDGWTETMGFRLVTD
jgi:formylglycine-generating enzyme required for sulfatase activity